MKKRRYVVTDIEPNAPCPVEPEPLGLGMWRYPWKDMQPGHWFVLREPSDDARARLASAAASAGRRLGAKFSTGPWFENDWDRQHSGWWCIRHDGCTVLGPSYSTKTERIAADAANKRKKQLADKVGQPFRPTRMQFVNPLGTHAPEVAQPLEEGDYSDWSKPVPPEEYV